MSDAEAQYVLARELADRARSVANRLRDEQQHIDSVLDEDRKARAGCAVCGSDADHYYPDGLGGTVVYCADCASRELGRPS